MATDPRTDRQGRRPAAPLGFPRSAAELDPRIDPTLLTAISRIAPGTPLRQGIEDDLGIVAELRFRLIAGQVGRQRQMSGCLHVRPDEIPRPATDADTVNEHEKRHERTLSDVTSA